MKKSVAALACLITLGGGTSDTGRSTQPIRDNHHDYSGSVWAAVGDSFTSGAGHGPFIDDNETNCSHSADSYADQLAAQFNVSDFVNVACAGASPEDVVSGSYGRPSQLDALSKDTDVVMMTVGANIVDLTKVFEYCQKRGCPEDDPLVMYIMETLESDEFVERLKNVYASVAHAAPNATVIVAQYIKPIDHEVRWCGDIVDKDTDRLVSTFVDTLNGQIAATVAEMRQAGYTQISTKSPERNLDVCSMLGAKMFVGDTRDTYGVGHPTREGYRSMANAVQSTIEAQIPPQSRNFTLAQGHKE